MTEPLEMMTCDWCGKEFPADARACVEAGVETFTEPEEGEEWKGDQPVTIGLDELTPAQREHFKSFLGLNDAQLQQLLETGAMDDLGSIVCLECQDASEAL